jgi:2,4-dienoyl-CoA reductase-like NADH-dependent reductase (Old Yellow Enzyme family)
MPTTGLNPLWQPVRAGDIHLPHRLAMAPMTRDRSTPEGVPTELNAEYYAQRASNALIITEGTQPSADGQGYLLTPGMYTGEQVAGWRKVTDAVHAAGGRIVVQLMHTGRIAHPDNTPHGRQPVAPSAVRPAGTMFTPSGPQEMPRPRALSTQEVAATVGDFRRAAAGAVEAGADGVEIHGANGYLVHQFLSGNTNRRTDRYGGSAANRARIVFDIIKGVRARTRPDFQLGIRISPERFGLVFAEQLALAEQLLTSGDLDYVDMSLWDCFKLPVEAAYAGKPLIDWFAELPRGRTRLGAAGKLMRGDDMRRLLGAGADFAILGRAAILHHDYPQRFAADPDFAPIALPVTRAHLAAEGLSPKFIEYMNGWKGFVAAEEAVEA